MSTIDGLPAHVVLLHVVVSLVPLTAVLLIVCALWPAARRRLIWLVVTFSAVTLVVTPLTITAGEWLADTGKFAGSPELDAHMAAGEYGLYMALGQAVAAALLAGLHLALTRGRAVGTLVRLGIVVGVITLAGGSMLAIHNIGSTGTKAAWGSLLAPSEDH
ncbi:hypothetical protein [Mycolicibacter arupensis]|jgi:hypothetical protein|uniref:DUF2231 domain-containing protein n=1 Tax=Mycolicibacter arupensis TaxID=342002 RepID=A0A0F5MSM2_9MYCO|nr:hypothetical protein [Mycolicibacter arupensis]KAA1431953.1 hypothetical protein F0402_05845 [Mycolicibacter arupensis]KKB97619.1 hypothetical protein WR43_18330 [Mycolicibacter arupensis]MCV7274637.1 hypothetical protein [Mycolicibacter arupensis]OQZ91657.1 hypothetical protein BST15_19675 [Mycolicibacter arupensis]TXI53675.1 MAG: hypothetical protein E6Q54_16170 [Mycolicibacter arupensis]